MALIKVAYLALSWVYLPMLPVLHWPVPPPPTTTTNPRRVSVWSVHLLTTVNFFRLAIHRLFQNAKNAILVIIWPPFLHVISVPLLSVVTFAIWFVLQTWILFAKMPVVYPAIFLLIQRYVFHKAVVWMAVWWRSVHTAQKVVIHSWAALLWRVRIIVMVPMLKLGARVTRVLVAPFRCLQLVHILVAAAVQTAAMQLKFPSPTKLLQEVLQELPLLLWTSSVTQNTAAVAGLWRVPLMEHSQQYGRSLIADVWPTPAIKTKQIVVSCNVRLEDFAVMKMFGKAKIKWWVVMQHALTQQY
jgi:hypothetical protein